MLAAHFKDSFLDEGADGPSSTQRSMDAADSACQQHDYDMLRIDEMYKQGEITTKEWNRLKTKYDYQFMWRVSKGGAPGYAAIAVIMFYFFRIAPR